ncbi:cation diffusion facilitator family transporter [Neisseriaceae bacterium TC5R-5]|nr:cation diffusion facilitator family transporter [Neisseriaceae bacterium TC5R-5]
MIDAVEKNNNLEQKALLLSLVCIVFLAVGALIYGVYLQSELIILNGIFSFISLLSSALSLIAAKLIAQPADKRFQYGYWHLEPLVHCINALILLSICVYAFINGIKGIKSGGNIVDAEGVMLYGIITAVVCFGIWLYEMSIFKKTKSQLILNDAKGWLMEFGFSTITLIGFAVLPLLNEPLKSTWALYADQAMVIVMAVMVMPIPFAILKNNTKEVLRITNDDEEIVGRIESVMKAIKNDYGVFSHSAHSVKIGKAYFIEINMVVSDDFKLQKISEQDYLRERIWQALGLKNDPTWFSVCITGDKRWE